MDKWLKNTNMVRIVALALGILLWAVIRIVDEKGAQSTAPVMKTREITNAIITYVGLDEEQFYLKSIEPSQVTVRYSGRDLYIDRVNPKEYHLQVDLTNISDGISTVPIEAVGFPQYVDVQIIPSYATINVEELVKKEMPVVLNINGTPADGHHVGQPLLTPNKVNVTVPSDLVEEVHTVTGEIDITGESSNVKKLVQLTAYDRQGTPIEAAITPQVVEAEVPITSPFKTVPLQLSYSGEIPQGYAVESIVQKQEQITVFSTPEKLAELEYYDGPTIDLTKLKESKKLTVDIPLRSDINHVEPNQVEVEISIVQITSRNVGDIPLTVQGLHDDLDIQIVDRTDQTVPVTLEGSSRLLSEVKVDDIHAYIDVSHLTAGTQKVPIEYEIPSHLKLSPNTIQEVTIELSTKSTEVSTENDDTGASSPNETNEEEDPVSPEQSEEDTGGPSNPTQPGVNNRDEDDPGQREGEETTGV